MFAGEERTGAVEARVDLVEHEDETVRIADRAKHRQKSAWRHHTATTALQRLDEDAANVALGDGVLDFGAQCREVRCFATRIRQKGREVRELRAKRLAKKRQCRRRERTEAQPVIPT